MAIGAHGNDGNGMDAGHVRVYGGSPLPVALVYFRSRMMINGVDLIWQTASEENNSGFDIQHSIDGKNWEILDFVQGKGTTLETQNYTYTDEAPLQGINYYRLKQIGYDGAFEYSNIIMVIFGNGEPKKLNVFPNPVQNQMIIINGQGLATIYNLLGQPVKELIIKNEELRIDVSDLAKGQYILSIQRETGEIITKKLIK